MGVCFSSIEIRNSSDSSSPAAKVITANADLREYNIPVTVAQVLDAETFSSPSSFLCNSDRLYHDNYIPILHSDDLLQANQIYFILPTSKLERKLKAADMAALAVKASAAMVKAAKNGGKRRKKAKISPVLLSEKRVSGGEIDEMKKMPPVGLSRSGSVRKLQRYTSKRARLAVRSFRMKLSTIYEGSVH